jgi:antitoxin ChpS
MPHTTRLRKVGGSVMLAIPPALLDALDLASDAPVNMTVKSGKLLIEGSTAPRYTLDELLAQCGPKKRRAAEERIWTKAPASGRELI